MSFFIDSTSEAVPVTPATSSEELKKMISDLDKRFDSLTNTVKDCTERCVVSVKRVADVLTSFTVDEHDHHQLSTEMAERIEMAEVEPRVDCSDTILSKSLSSDDSGTLDDVRYLPTGHELKEWIAMREQTIQMLIDIAAEIDKHAKNVNKARITGASTAIAGGLAALGGAIATLATAGLAAPITVPIIIAGTVVSITGGAASTGASITKIIISKVKQKTKKIQEQIDADQKMLKELYQLKKDSPHAWNHSEAELSAVSPTARAGSAVQAIAYTGGRAAGAAARGGKNVPRLGQLGSSIAKSGAAAVEIGSVALQGVAVAGIAVEIVVIPLNIAEIVTSGMSLYKRSETKASRKLRQKAEEYEEQMNKVKNDFKDDDRMHC